MAITDRPITIVGCGPGGAAYLTDAVRQAVNHAGLLIGASRLLELFPEAKGERVAVGTDMAAVLRIMEDRLEQLPIVVLVSGDPGLHSLAQPVLRRFGRHRCRLLPGISSVQAAFAAVGIDWMNVRILSAHGTTPDIDPRELASCDKIAVLAGSPAALNWTGKLAGQLEPRRILLCEDLSRTVVLLLRPEMVAYRGEHGH
ncbi:MAG: precorrin-6y C5,15-methyltransferase (decarboxylating) subunit CbiE [Desulfuromonadaceae bacterium]